MQGKWRKTATRSKTDTVSETEYYRNRRSWVKSIWQNDRISTAPKSRLLHITRRLFFRPQGRIVLLQAIFRSRVTVVVRIRVGVSVNMTLWSGFGWRTENNTEPYCVTGQHDHCVPPA